MGIADRNFRPWGASCKCLKPKVSHLWEFRACDVERPAPQDMRRGALKVLRSELFEVSSNLEATTAMTAYVIEVFGSL